MHLRFCVVFTVIADVHTGFPLWLSLKKTSQTYRAIGPLDILSAETIHFLLSAIVHVCIFTNYLLFSNMSY
jgi:hypothetical protein